MWVIESVWPPLRFKDLITEGHGVLEVWVRTQTVDRGSLHRTNTIPD